MTYVSAQTQFQEFSKDPACTNAKCKCNGNCLCAKSKARADMADLSKYRNDLSIISVQKSDDALRIIWSDGSSSRFHFGWLRENDPSPCSRHPQSRERIVHPLEISPFIAPVNIMIDRSGALKLEWAEDDGGHISRYDAGWLHGHAYNLISPSTNSNQPSKKEDKPAPAEADWADIMTSERAFYDWLEDYLASGWSIISGVPDKEGCAVAFGQRIGVVRSSNFGFSFDVRSKPQPISNAYTAGYLPLHTDMPHYELPPGLQILHALRNEAEGGESLMADGLAVAEHLRREEPGIFKLLTETTIPFRFQDETGDYKSRHPILEQDQNGSLAYVNWSNSTAAPLDVSYHKMPAMRAAIRRFVQHLESDRFLITRKLKAGEMMVFDNRRMLHGRNAFDPETGGRHLQGCYLDTAEVLSRREVCARQFAPLTSTAA